VNQVTHGGSPSWGGDSVHHLYAILDLCVSQSGEQRPTVHVKLRSLKNSRIKIKTDARDYQGKEH